MPKGVLSFALKACTNGLNTPDNLKRWGKRKMDKCDLCGNYANLEHILNWCSVSLHQGRTKWRHDSVLDHMFRELVKGKKNEVTMYAHIPGHQVNGGTIPADILTTAQRPDIVLVNRSEKKIALLELTISFEKNIDSANQKKTLRYLNLAADLTNAGWEMDRRPFEVGSRGQITKRNKTTICDITRKYGLNVKKSKLLKDLSKIALLCSFIVFQAHCQPDWQASPFLHP